MNPEQWLSLKWNGGSTMSDRWLNQSKIINKSTVYANFTGGKVELVIYIRLRKKGRKEYNINYYGGRYRIKIW